MRSASLDALQRGAARVFRQAISEFVATIATCCAEAIVATPRSQLGHVSWHRAEVDAALARDQAAEMVQTATGWR